MMFFSPTYLSKFAKTAAHALLLTASAACIWAAMLFVAACSNTPATSSQWRLTVSVPPLRGVVEAITDSDADVSVLLPAGASPETFDPTPQQMLHISESKALIRFGTLGFERTLVTALASTAPATILIDAAPVNKDLPEALRQDPHVWTSPAMLKEVAYHTAEALAALDTTRQQTFYERAETFAARMDSLSQSVRHQLSNAPCRAFVIHHPALAHFAAEFGLHQIAIEQEGREAGAKRLADVIAQAQAEKVRVVFITPGHPTDLARRVAESIGADVVEINPLEENYEQFLHSVCRALVPANS